MGELWLEPDYIVEKKKHCPKTGRFVKGMTPWNKGTKGLNNGGKQTQFKPGHLPENAKNDGTISTRNHKRDERSYKYIRISKNNWIPLHRFIYESIHGQIPKNSCIAFKDGNSLNCDIDNLECISRKENMNRNRNYEKAKETMKQTWRRDKLRFSYGLSTVTKWFNK